MLSPKRIAWTSLVTGMMTMTSLGFGEIKTTNSSPLHTETKTAIVETIGKLLIEKYIDLESATNIRDHLLTRLASGDYDPVDDPVSFAQMLTADLFETSRDYHFFIEFNPDRAKLIRAHRSRSKEELLMAREKSRDEARWDNFCFHKLERLPGNIGYLDLRSFSNPALGGDTAVAAMNFLANSAAIIVDLRNNRCGSPAI